MKLGAMILGLVFAAVALIYFLMPAGSLPHFFPGFEPGSDHVHVKHGVASLAVALGLFFFARFVGRSSR
jgi:hypothetical protein